jgi:hypothetical protein
VRAESPNPKTAGETSGPPLRMEVRSDLDATAGNFIRPLAELLVRMARRELAARAGINPPPGETEPDRVQEERSDSRARAPGGEVGPAPPG